ncbi:helix-turn-helix domain-containing protein [Streptomyces roseicoloratus]|uniref:Helix-turn-helix transcriptional regulator n=1 Tax=Streptomyces roseicoloratus TaxID=2508722 RepID=A0ABY9RSD7_9ACTN|nr:helix-turn-helix transcriptional regulator [Streptomyces roseicoloratus]WMX44608.1 helix-turn-helix transcriptional regulator [Streptomyces roseicoloratus]
MTTNGGAGDNDDLPAVCEAEREPDPSDSLRTFGAVVQALREHAGLSRVQFGELVRFSKHTVESVELGRRMPDESFVDRAEGATGNTGALRKAAPFLSRGEAGLAAWFRQWARLEKVAVSLCTYECRLVPGMLQSEAYARAVFENGIPLLSDEQLETQVEARMKRQRVLYERVHVPFSFIVEEHVFRRRLGGAGVMRGLIDHVLTLSALRNVTLQIVSMDADAHGCLDGPMWLLETPKGQRVAYSEGQQNGRLIADVKEVSLLQQRYDRLRSQALNAKDSRGLLERLRGEL